MEKLEFTYNEEALGWSSGKIVLLGEVQYFIKFNNEYGCVVVQKQNGEGAPSPKVFISPMVKELQLRFYGDCYGKIVEIFTSCKPATALYVNLENELRRK